ncbi:lipoprotein insertase outer membrane protein LolB [Aliikangiella sp. IMCC44359]|uniref:lipoprotein insertase outer membrane protein LolB n=1 Tax=Aliikangiella sp. IMCC44359 TaxID=3459125 RepID=UPI00403AE268
MGTKNLDIPNKLSAINHWQLKARIAIRSDDESIAATLDWQKQDKDFDFHIYGTFGVTYAHLTQKGHEAKLMLPDDQTFYHQDAQQLLYQSLGWDFPIEALSYWIKGQASGQPGESVQRNSHGELEQIILNDWQVSFSRYETFSGFSMPKVIKANHPQMSMKVVIKKWQFLPQPI